MNENVEQLNKPTKRETTAFFWDRVWEATNQIEALNSDDEADLYDTLGKVQNILEELECAGTFATGRHTTEVVCLIVAVYQAIGGVTFDHTFAVKAAE